LEEIDLGDRSIKRPTYISSKIGTEFKIWIVPLLRKYKDCFGWDYNKMLGLSKNVV